MPTFFFRCVTAISNPHTQGNKDRGNDQRGRDAGGNTDVAPGPFNEILEQGLTDHGNHGCQKKGQQERQDYLEEGHSQEQDQAENDAE